MTTVDGHGHKENLSQWDNNVVLVRFRKLNNTSQKKFLKTWFLVDCLLNNQQIVPTQTRVTIFMAHKNNLVTRKGIACRGPSNNGIISRHLLQTLNPN